MQGANYVLPLITFPYLISVLGAEKFGIISFAQAVSQYLVVITDYGFNLTATRQISVHREDPHQVSMIFSSVFTVKLLLLVLSVLVYLPIVLLVPQLQENSDVFLLYLGWVVGYTLFPIWLFQGLEKMKFITFVNVLAKLLFTVSIFIFVKEENDFALVPLLQSFGFLVAGVISLGIAFQSLNVKFKLVSFKALAEQFREGWHVFVSSVTINFYRNTNIVLLGFLTGDNVIVGYYSIAEKIVKVIQSISNPVSQALYPFFSKKFSQNTVRQSVQTLFKLLKVYGISLGIVSILLFITAEPLLKAFVKEYHPALLLDIRILSSVILFGGLNYLVGIIGLINLGQKKTFTLGVVIGGLLNLLLCAILIPLLQDKGAAIALAVSEFALFVFLALRLKQFYKKSWKLQQS